MGLLFFVTCKFSLRLFSFEYRLQLLITKILAAVRSPNFQPIDPDSLAAQLVIPLRLPWPEWS
jgi:hypothetical protein